MDILTLVRVFFRRWYVSIPVLVLAGGFAAYVQSTVPPAYEASGSILMEQPQFDPSRLPISLIDLNGITLEMEASAGSEDLLVRARDNTSVEVIAVADSAADATAQVVDQLSTLDERITEVQTNANVPEEERVFVSTPEIPEAEELADERFQVGVVAPIEDPSAQVENPYGPGDTTGQLLQVAVTSDRGRAALREVLGPEISYSVGIPSSGGGIMSITTMGPDPEAVIAAFEPVRAAMAEELEARQDRAEVPTSRHLRLEVIAEPGTVLDVSPPLDRSVAAILGLGGLLALGAAIVTENVAARRRRSATQPTSSPDAWWSSLEGQLEAGGPQDIVADPETRRPVDRQQG